MNVFPEAVIDHPRSRWATTPMPVTSTARFRLGQARLAPYIFPFSQEKLIIGKFGQFADGVRSSRRPPTTRWTGFRPIRSPFSTLEGVDGYIPSLPTGRKTR
jgi:virginiamycin A acetyltransferase